MKLANPLTIEAYLAHTNQVDCVLDVRTPAEFELDHIPHAINTPVLSNDERIYIGTLNREVSSFEAKRVGARLMSHNVAQLLALPLFNQPKAWSPLVYCWRGGNRSEGLVHILRKIGWSATKLEGGYKSFRNKVIADGLLRPLDFRFVVISGCTGVGKTQLLVTLKAQGAQVLNLEHLANHSGSLFGAANTNQPSQKAFETGLWHTLNHFDPQQAVFVECESSTIGKLRVPEPLMHAIRLGQCLNIDMTMQQRVNFLMQQYAHLMQDADYLCKQLVFLAPLHGHKQIKQWCDLAQNKAWFELTQQLLTKHYDPMYYRSLQRNFSNVNAAKHYVLDNQSQTSLAELANTILSGLDVVKT